MTEPAPPPDEAPLEEENGEDVAASRAKALAAIEAIKNKAAAQAPAEVKGEAAAPAADENGHAQAAEPEKPRRKRFGPPANAPREAPKRKRRSRWETQETSDSKALIVQSGPLWPTDVTLPGGLSVRLSASLNTALL